LDTGERNEPEQINDQRTVSLISVMRREHQRTARILYFGGGCAGGVYKTLGKRDSKVQRDGPDGPWWHWGLKKKNREKKTATLLLFPYGIFKR